MNAVRFLPALCATLGSFVASPLLADAFTPGNLVVYTINGSAALTSAATPVSLFEFSPSGGAGFNPINLPSSGVAPFYLTASGTATSDGHLYLNATGTALTMAGYDATAGTTGVVAGASSGRFVTVTPDGNYTASSGFARGANNVRGAISTGTGGTFVALAAGVSFFADPSAAPVSILGTGSWRGLALAGNTVNSSLQLYGATASAAANGGVNTIGAGLPNSATTATLLPGFTSANNSQNAFRFLDLDNNGAVDTLYLALGTTTGGIQRFNFNGSSWTLAYTLNATAPTGFFGLTARVDPNNPSQVQLFATTQGAANGGNSLLGLTDSATAGNTTPLGLAALTLATAGPNQSFRGVDFAPIPEPGTVALAVVGGVAVLALRRRQRA